MPRHRGSDGVAEGLDLDDQQVLATIAQRRDEEIRFAWHAVAAIIWRWLMCQFFADDLLVAGLVWWAEAHPTSSS